MAQLRVTNQLYEKTRSPQEIKEGIYIITKQALTFFPPLGEEFSLEIGTKTVQTKIYAQDCLCRGPNKPHYHYFMDISSFCELLPEESKAILTICKISAKNYHLSTNSYE